MIMVMREILLSGFAGLRWGPLRPPPYPDWHYLQGLESAQESGKLITRGLVIRDASALAAIDMDESIARRAGAVRLVGGHRAPQPRARMADEVEDPIPQEGEP